MLELPAPASGALVEILKGDGSTVAGQEVIAIIDTDAKAQRRGAPADAPREPAKPAAAQRSGPGRRRLRRMPAPPRFRLRAS